MNKDGGPVSPGHGRNPSPPKSPPLTTQKRDWLREISRLYTQDTDDVRNLICVVTNTAPPKSHGVGTERFLQVGWRECVRCKVRCGAADADLAVVRREGLRRQTCSLADTSGKYILYMSLPPTHVLPTCSRPKPIILGHIFPCLFGFD